ncbi:MAG TPA: hypothetical protein VF367_09180 [Candidatus Limnocylindria bacterium]|jgi:hypothetical protein
MMRTSPSVAERLDAAVELLADGATPSVAAAASRLAGDERRLVDAADRLRRATPAPPLAPRFEAALGARLAGMTVRDPRGWALRHPGRLIVGGAVGSAVGVGVTAYAVWRTTRRPSAASRLLHR